jgi:hypothetical protein
MRAPSLRMAAAIVAVTLVSSCGSPAPVVVVDAAHSQVGQPKGTTGTHYVLAPTSRIRVDARQFDFSKSLYPDVKPNAVQVVLGDRRQYTAEWVPSGLVSLSRATLVPMNSSPPFDGFKSGDQAVIAIGEQRMDEAQKEIVLKLLWAGLIDFKP